MKLQYSFALYSKFFLVKHHYVEDMFYKRILYKKSHLDVLENLKKEAQVIGGALFPYTGAYFIINCNNEDVVKSFILNDPYCKEKLAQPEYEEISITTQDNFDQLASVLGCS